MGVYPSTHLGWPGRLEETVPQRPKMADGSRDRAPGNRTDVEWVSELVVNFHLPGGPSHRFPTGSPFRALGRDAAASRLHPVSRPHGTAGTQTGSTELIRDRRDTSWTTPVST